MEIKKTSEIYNSLLKRKELTFLANHTSSCTPKLFEIRKALANMYGATEETVYIRKMETSAGTNQTRGEAEIYDSSERSELLVPKYIQSRNLSTRGQKQEEKGKDQKKKEKEKENKK